MLWAVSQYGFKCQSIMNNCILITLTTLCMYSQKTTVYSRFIQIRPLFIQQAQKTALRAPLPLLYMFKTLLVSFWTQMPLIFIDFCTKSPSFMILYFVFCMKSAWLRWKIRQTCPEWCWLTSEDLWSRSEPGEVRSKAFVLCSWALFAEL